MMVATRIPPWADRAGRWVLFTAALWWVLRPSLAVSITYDDFFNPVRVRELYGANPFSIVSGAIRDLNANGHFNYIGTSLGGLYYVAWDQLAAAGIRLTTSYALTKLVAFIVAIVAAARLLRVLLELLGRSWSVWRARITVAVLLIATMQLHVAWSFDPVASFPLWGYLSVGVGFGAMIVAIPALAGTSNRSPWWATLALCLSIQYYEINVAVVAALVPVGVLLLRRSTGEGRRDILRRAKVLLVPPAAMTVVLALWARHANEGYEGTQTGLSSGGLGNLGRSFVSSFPMSSWPQARDFLDTSPPLTVWLVIAAVIVGTTTLVLAGRPSEPQPPVAWIDAALVAASMLTVWLAATLIQGATVKVNVQSWGLGNVYMYYAYGSLALPLAAVLLLQAWPGAAWWRQWWQRWLRPAALAGTIVFAFVQLSLNDGVQRHFDARYPAFDTVLDAYADQPPEPERCAALAEWKAMRDWSIYYPSFPRSLDVVYHEHHGVPFCSEPGTQDAP